MCVKYILTFYESYRYEPNRGFNRVTSPVLTYIKAFPHYDKKIFQFIEFLRICVASSHQFFFFQS